MEKDKELLKSEILEIDNQLNQTKNVIKYDKENKNYYKLLYSIEDSPPWYMAIVLALQVSLYETFGFVK